MSQADTSTPSPSPGSGRLPRTEQRPQSYGERLHAAFHQPDTPIYRATQGTVWALIVLSIALFGVELSLDKGHSAHLWLERIDVALMIFFGLEIVVRIATWQPPAQNFYKPSALSLFRSQIWPRVAYCLEPLNLVDIMTVLAVVPALRGLRALRLLRLLRSTRLLRYSNPFAGVVRAFEENGLLFTVAFSLVGLITMVGGISIYLVDGEKNNSINSLADGFYWALVTLTTVGFGDISPQTTLGRLVAAALMIAGMFTLALFAGIVGHTLLHTILSVRQEQFRMSAHVNHIVVCGYNPGARMLLEEILKEFSDTERELVICAPGERPPYVPPEFTWISGDPTKESELDKVRLAHAAAVIIVGSRSVEPQLADATTILTTFTVRAYIKEHKATTQRAHPLYIVTEILDEENVEHAKTAGADEVIETTRLGFSMMAHAVSMPGTGAIISRVAAAGAHSLYTTPVPPDIECPQRYDTVAHVLKNRHKCLLIGVRDAQGDEVINPPDSTTIESSMQLIYLAEAPLKFKRGLR